MVQLTSTSHQQQAETQLVRYFGGYEPHLDIRVENCRFFFTAPNSEFWVYRNLRAIGAPPSHRRSWPSWNLVLTNQTETLFVWSNTNEISVQLVNEETELVVSYTSIETAQQISREIINLLESNCTAKEETLGTTYQPDRLAFEYICDETMYSFN